MVKKKLKKGWEWLQNYLDTQIPDLKKSKNKRFLLILPLTLFLIIIFTLILIFSTYAFTKILEPIINIFFHNFQKQALVNSFAILTICFLFFGSFAFPKWLIGSLTRIKVEWTMFLLVSITTTVFLCGVGFLDATVGASNTDWRLLDGQGNKTAEIDCSDFDGKLIYGNFITCKLKNYEFSPQNIKGESEIALHNGSSYTQDLGTNSLNFIPQQQDIHRIFLNLEIETTHNNSFNLSTTIYPKFYTKEDEKQREKEFFTYFFGLLFLSLITIPQLIMKLSKFFKEKNEKAS